MLIKLAGEGVAVRDRTAGCEAIRDKIAGGEAAHDNTAGERVDEEADEITIEEIVINSIIEAFIDKIAGGKAILEAAERGEEFTVELSDEAVRVAAERS